VSEMLKGFHQNRFQTDKDSLRIKLIRSSATQKPICHNFEHKLGAKIFQIFCNLELNHRPWGLGVHKEGDKEVKKLRSEASQGSVVLVRVK